MPRLILMALSLIYALTSLFIVMFYLRRKFMKADLTKCFHCPFHNICSKLRINRLLPPAKFVQRPPESLKIKITFSVIGGYVVTLLIGLALIGLNSKITVNDLIWSLFPFVICILLPISLVFTTSEPKTQ